MAPRRSSSSLIGAQEEVSLWPRCRRFSSWPSWWWSIRPAPLVVDVRHGRQRNLSRTRSAVRRVREGEAGRHIRNAREVGQALTLPRSSVSAGADDGEEGVAYLCSPERSRRAGSGTSEFRGLGAGVCPGRLDPIGPGGVID